MTYRFHCSATGDVLMLQHAGDTVLSAMGIEPAAKGIIEPAAMPAAIEAIQAAIARDESAQDRAEAAATGTHSRAEEFDMLPAGSIERRSALHRARSVDEHEVHDRLDAWDTEGGAGAQQEHQHQAVSLRQRAWPLVDMMRRAHAEGAAIVWGV